MRSSTYLEFCSRTYRPIHGYILNEMNCAVIYPNVRGSAGYGKKFMAADDVEKREDSVKSALFHLSIHISSSELD